MNFRNLAAVIAHDASRHDARQRREQFFDVRGRRFCVEVHAVLSFERAKIARTGDAVHDFAGNKISPLGIAGDASACLNFAPVQTIM